MIICVKYFQTEEKYDAGGVVIQKGDLGVTFYVLKEGKCEAVVGDQEKVVRTYTNPGKHKIKI